MAGRAGLIDKHQQAIPITINPQLDQLLDVARAFALNPERLTGTRPISDLARGKCLRDRFGIHPGHHQHLARVMILRDGRNQTIGVIFQAGGVEHQLSFRLHRTYLDAVIEREKTMSDSDLMQLYSRRILALASDIPHLGKLGNPTGSAHRRSPQCGSSVTAHVVMQDGRIVDFSQEVRACALGQASAGVLGRTALGRSRDEIARARDELQAMLKTDGPAPAAPFDELETLLPAREFPNRHASILLAWEALLGAIDASPA